MREIVYSDVGNGELVAEPSPAEKRKRTREKRQDQERREQRFESITGYAVAAFCFAGYAVIFTLWVFYT